MQEKFLDELFEKIQNTTGIEDIGYHEIRDGRLHPIYKTKTNALAMEQWKNIHAQNVVYIEEHKILMKIAEEKEPIAISDVNSNELSSNAFFLFGIDSILVVPVMKSETLEGIICIASIGQPHEFTLEEIKKCETLIKDYMNR